MLIGLTSDSHGGLSLMRNLLATLHTQGVRNLIHAGDFAVSGIEKVFADFSAIKIWLARGNCDVNTEIWQAVTELPNVKGDSLLEFELAGKNFACAHAETLACSAQSAEIYVFGHTHIPRAEKKNGKQFLNPGSLFEGKSYFLLDLPSLKIKQKFLSQASQEDNKIAN